MSIYLSLLICLLGLLGYALATEGPARAKIAALSLHMFWVGLLAFLLQFLKVIHT